MDHQATAELGFLGGQISFDDAERENLSWLNFLVQPPDIGKTGFLLFLVCGQGFDLVRIDGSTFNFLDVTPDSIIS